MNISNTELFEIP